MNFSSNPNNLLLHQQEMTAQINQMLAQSSEALMCGPDCQKQNEIAKLKQQLADAKTNIKTGPIQLKQAEKKYYTFAEGNAAYNNIVNTDLTNQASEIGATMTDNFNNNIESATSLTDIYHSLTTNYNHILELYTEYINDNDALNNKIINHRTDLVTTDRKTYYETQNSDNLLMWYNIFRWIYFILVIIFVIAIFLADSGYSFTKKILLLLLIFVYPLVINPIVTKLFTFIHYVTTLLPKNIYKSM